jgi:hypothetical protein
VELQTVFDTERDHYQVVSVGWDSKNKFRTILRRFSDHSDYQELLSPLGVRL